MANYTQDHHHISTFTLLLCWLQVHAVNEQSLTSHSTYCRLFRRSFPDNWLYCTNE